MCEPGFYRATVSYDAFRNRENRRLYEANLRGIRDLPLRTSLGHEEDNTLWQGFAYIGEPYPQTVKHVNLWAFYKAIGYDYKRKRYEV